MAIQSAALRQEHFREMAQGRGKRERTRAAMLDAVVHLVAEKGIDATSISEIAATAGVANGTFYNHFDNKDEIMLAAAFGVAAAVGEKLDAEMVGIDDAATRVVTATLRVLSILLAEPEWAAFLLDATQQSEEVRAGSFQYLRADIERGVEQGRFDVVVDQFLLDQVGALIAVAVRVQLAEGRDLKLDHRLCENILRLLGMTPARARKAVAAAIEKP